MRKGILKVVTNAEWELRKGIKKFWIWLGSHHEGTIGEDTW